MPTPDPRIDAYIAKAAPFAQPILRHLRALVHRALPEIEEGIKWGMPHFMLHGKNVAGIAAFKAHCAFVIHGEGRQGRSEAEGMGGYGKIASLGALPCDEELETQLREAAQRVAVRGSALPAKAKKPPKPDISMPPDFAAALGAQPSAKQSFEGFSNAQQRDYLEWITSAKQAATRERRIAQAAEWIAAGKRRNWKYESC